MKKHSISLSVFALFSFAITTNAQQTTVNHPGKLHVSAGIGIVPTFAFDKTTTDMPPLSLKFGYDVSKNFSLSAFAGYSAYGSQPRVYSDGVISAVNNRTFLGGLRGEMKKQLTPRMNFYGGAMLGFNYTDLKEVNPATGEEMIKDPNAPSPYNPDAKNGKLLYSAFVGTTWFASKNIGVFAEAGYGVSLLTTGLTFRL